MEDEQDVEKVRPITGGGVVSGSNKRMATEGKLAEKKGP